MESELDRPVKKLVASPLMLRLLSLFNKEIAETVEMIYEWVNPFVVDTSKAENAFGLLPTPLEQAMQETLDWCKAQTMK